MNEKRKAVENYLEKYFDEWLINDIDIILKIMKEKNLNFTLPIILLVCAGIDFSGGGVIFGFKKDNVGDRSKFFIREYMGRINPLYNDEEMSGVIYDCVRCGSVHRAMYKQGVEISSNPSTNNHLTFSKSGNLIIDTFKFANDFKEAFKKFRGEYKEGDIEALYKNLDEMIKDTSNLISSLRKNNYIKHEIHIQGTSKAPEEWISKPPEGSL